MLYGVGRQGDIAAEETPTDGYVSLDVSVSWRPFENMQWVDLSLVGHNLTNAIQRNAVSINKDQILLPGRDVQFTLRLKV